MLIGVSWQNLLYCIYQFYRKILVFLQFDFLYIYFYRSEFIKKIAKFIKDYSYEGARTNANKPSWFSKVTPFRVKFSLNVTDESPYSDYSTVFEEVELELQRNSSWLYTDDRYAHIRKLALEDKIALITENICAFDRFNSLARLLMENMIQIDTIYVSNISEWIFRNEDRESFFKTIQFLLADQDTILIDAKIRSADSVTPYQRLITNRELKQSNLENWFYLKSAQLEEIQEAEPADALASF